MEFEWPFVPGLRLSEVFFTEGIRPVLERHAPQWYGIGQHAPYMKWFGSAFAQLHSANTLGPLLKAAAQGVDWKTREEHLSAAYSILAARHNALGLTPALETQVRPFHQRPYQVIDADRFAEALVAQVRDEMVRSLPKGVGAVWQFADSTDVLDEVERFRALGVVYGGLADLGVLDGR